MSIITSNQRHQILNSLNEIKKEISRLQATAILTDYELELFYEELLRKAEFGYNFLKCARMVYNMQNEGEKWRD